MNQDIIDWLEGYWELDKDDYGGYGEPRYAYTRNTEQGAAEYHPVSNTLYLWSGLGLEEYYGYTVQIRDLQHLIQLEALL